MRSTNATARRWPIRSSWPGGSSGCRCSASAGSAWPSAGTTRSTSTCWPIPSGALAASELWGLVGFLAFALGTEIPGLRRVGSAVSSRLPRDDWPPGATVWPAGVLIVAGLVVAATALATNRLGYDAATRQDVSPIPAYLQTIALVGVAVLWFDLIRTPSPGVRRVVLTTGAIGVAAVVGAGLAESRATLATWVLVVLLVTALARVTIATRLAVTVVAVAGVALVLGALIGSTYREIRAEDRSGQSSVGTREPARRRGPGLRPHRRPGVRQRRLRPRPLGPTTRSARWAGRHRGPPEGARRDRHRGRRATRARERRRLVHPPGAVADEAGQHRSRRHLPALLRVPGQRVRDHADGRPAA